MNQPNVVSRSAWLAVRKQLLSKEKEFTRRRDALSLERRKLPMVKLEKNYIFEGPEGPRSLGDLFAGRRQLIVTISCSIPNGTKAAGAAHTSQIISWEASYILLRETPRSPSFLAHP